LSVSRARAPRAEAPARLALRRSQRGVLEAEARAALLEAVRALLARPTAPYAEDFQVAAVREFVQARPGLELSADEHANLLVSWPGTGRARRAVPLAFSAHLDHPGFLYAGKSGGRHRARFHGGVPARAMPGAPVRFFDLASGATCATARVESVEKRPDGALVASLGSWVGSAARGALGMWDLPAFELRGGRLSGRVCDDLLGAAATLALLDALHRERHPRPVLGVFTRAEETGFIGCQGLLRSRALPRGTAVIGLECSPRRSTARVGRGPVIRVGDAASVFDPALTHLLQDAAARLSESNAGFRWQRALMDGGRCESTAYNLWGVPAGGLCLALAHYHNVADSGPRKGRIAPELVAWHDLEGLLALMHEAARGWARPAASARMLARLDRVWDLERGRLAASAARVAGRAQGAARERRRR
jgi:putative aminopeptidase FrvX